MTGSRAKSLASLFRSVAKAKRTRKPSASRAGDSALEQFVTSFEVSSSSSASTSASASSKSYARAESASKTFPAFSLTRILDPALKSGTENSEQSAENLSQEISSILDSHDSPAMSECTNSENSQGKAMVIPWLSTVSNNNVPLRRKEFTRHRKSKWIFNSGQSKCFNRLFKLCTEKIGAGTTLKVFGKLGRETGLKEYNASIAAFVENARASENTDDALENLSEAFRLFNEMREHGFELEEATYGPLLLYFVDRGMVEEFHFFCDSIKVGNLRSLPRLGYYEMLLWIKVNHEEKIQELCNFIADDNRQDTFKLRENYFLALCECDRKDDLVKLLEILDLTRLSSVADIFKSLGRLSLEPLVEKCLLNFRACGRMVDSISNLIFSYATSIPNLAVEDVVLKFKSLHARVDVSPSSSSYEKLISHCCDSNKVHLALDIVDQMCDADCSISMYSIHRILHLCEESNELNLVWRIYSLICQHNFKANAETFRSMINMSVRMKDFNAAFSLLGDLKKMNVTPTATIYNTIVAGYFREKKVTEGLKVLKQMELDNVEPDSQTFSYLISNCDNEENIVKYYDKMKSSQVPVTKHIFMALINAYASCGEFEKAKQVLSEKDIPVKSLNEIKSVLISALASAGRISDALSIYEAIKQAGCCLEPKAVMALIEHSEPKGDLALLLQLLKELEDPDYWDNGCCRIISFCIRNKHLRCAIDLLKQLKDRFQGDELVIEVLFDEVFSMIGEMEPPDLQIGLDLLQAVKDEFGVMPSRKCLDFLLNACVNAKDLSGSLFIWKEYEKAGFTYNVINYLRMYQALLASGACKEAKCLLSKIPKEDFHVRYIIKACQATYPKSASNKRKDSRAIGVDLEERLSE